MALRFPTEDVVAICDFLIHLADNVLNCTWRVLVIGLVLCAHLFSTEKRLLCS